MGLFDSTSTSSPQYSPAVSGLQDQIIAGAGKGMAPWLTNPTYSVAPQDPWQTQAGGAASGLLGAGSSGSYAPQMAVLLGDVTGQLGAGERALGPASQVSTVGAGDIGSIAQPLEQMLDQNGMQQLNQQIGQQETGIGQRAAAGGAFGGSREAVERGMLGQQALQATNTLLGNDASTAYQLGTGVAQGNANNKNAGSQFIANTMLGSTGLNLSTLGLGGNLLSSADSSRLAGLGYDAQTAGLLGSFGDQQQQYDQSVLDAPYTQASRFAGYVPGISPTTVSTQQPSTMQTIGSLLSSIF